MHTYAIREDGVQIEFLIVEVNHAVQSVFVRGNVVVPYAFDGITRNAWAKQFENMVTQPGRWEEAEIINNKIRFTTGYIGGARHCFASVQKSQSGDYSISLINDEYADVVLDEGDHGDNDLEVTNRALEVGGDQASPQP